MTSQILRGFARLEIVSRSNQHLPVVIMAPSYHNWVLASHKTNFESVVQGA